MVPRGPMARSVSWCGAPRQSHVSSSCDDTAALLRPPSRAGSCSAQPLRRLSSALYEHALHRSCAAVHPGSVPPALLGWLLLCSAISKAELRCVCASARCIAPAPFGPPLVLCPAHRSHSVQLVRAGPLWSRALPVLGRFCNEHCTAPAQLCTPALFRPPSRAGSCSAQPFRRLSSAVLVHPRSASILHRSDLLWSCAPHTALTLCNSFALDRSGPVLCQY